MNSENFNIDISECPENLHPEIYKRLKAGYRAPLSALPGKEMGYCNFGFTLLAEIIRRVSGKNLHVPGYHSYESLKMPWGSGGFVPQYMTWLCSVRCFLIKVYTGKRGF